MDKLVNRVGSRGEALLIMEGDATVAERHGLEPLNKREDIYLQRRQRVNQIVTHVVKDISKKTAFSNILSRMMIKPLTGIPILFLALYTMYQIIGVFVAGTFVGYIWKPYERSRRIYLRSFMVFYGERFTE